MIIFSVNKNYLTIMCIFNFSQLTEKTSNQRDLLVFLITYSTSCHNTLILELTEKTGNERDLLVFLITYSTSCHNTLILELYSMRRHQVAARSAIRLQPTEIETDRDRACALCKFFFIFIIFFQKPNKFRSRIPTARKKFILQ
jgi:hypothetical protein